MRHVMWFLLVLAVALPEAARADAFSDLQLIRPSRSVAAADFTVAGLTGSPLRLGAAMAIGPRDWDGKAAHAAVDTLLK